MLTEIPDWLLEMSEQLNTQDNRITANPTFQVRCERWVTAAEDRGDKHVYLLYDQGDFTEFDSIAELMSHIREYYPEYCRHYAREHGINIEDDITDGGTLWYLDELEATTCVSVEKLYLQKTEEVVRTCYTEKDANDFIARKQHDYPKLYTYVETMNHCPQMIKLREWIMNLNKEN